jgi:hypothetical protein
MVAMRIVAGALALFATAACFSRPGLARNDGGGDDDDAAPDDDGGVDFDVLPGGPYNVMFVTSDTRAIWQLNNQATADAWCESKSTNLPPNTYRAWLSVTAETAPGRMGTGRGWIRPDGQPVASTLADLTSGNHLYPPRLDENGTDVTASDPRIATGTNATGQLGLNCSDLDNRGQDFTYGNSDAAAYLWTQSGQRSCDEQDERIYCLGIDHANPIDLQPDPNYRLAFISNQKHGLGGGETALDSACQAEASGVPLTGTFRAAVALTGQSILSRFPDGQPWARVDGVVVLPADMSSLLAPIWLDARGNRLTDLPDGAVVWTGASAFVEPAPVGKTCNNWGSTASLPEQATTGFALRSRMAEAVGSGTSGCNNQWHVYCLQM